MRAKPALIAKKYPLLYKGAWLVPLFLSLLLFTSGCASMTEAFSEKPKATEIAVYSPPAYGTITKVTTGAMLDRENRKGDIAISIVLDDGQMIVVVQSEDDVYTAGDRVMVLRDGKGFVRAQVL